MRWAYLQSAKLVLIKNGKYIKTLTFEECQKAYPDIFAKIVAEKI